MLANILYLNTPKTQFDIVGIFVILNKFKLVETKYFYNIEVVGIENRIQFP